VVFEKMEQIKKSDLAEHVGWLISRVMLSLLDVVLGRLELV